MSVVKNRLRKLLHVRGAFSKLRRYLRKCGDQFFSRQRHPDNAGRRREYLFGRAAELLCGSLAHAQAGFDALFSSGAVGIAGIDRDKAYTFRQIDANDRDQPVQAQPPVRLLVKTAAAVVPSTAGAQAKSGLPLGLMPARTAPKRKPAGA